MLKGITSKHVGDFYCLNCFHSYTTENKLKQHESVYKNYVYSYVEMPKENNKILKYNREEKSMKVPFTEEKSMKVPFIIHADLESLLEKISTCLNNPKKSSTTKIFSLLIYLLIVHC